MAWAGGFVLPGRTALQGREAWDVRDAEREAKDQRRHERVGEFLDAVAAGRGAEGLTEGRVTAIRMRLPSEEDPSTLLIVKVSSEEGDSIAFVGAFSLCDAILAWRARSEKGTMQWRDDVPWAER